MIGKYNKIKCQGWVEQLQKPIERAYKKKIIKKELEQKWMEEFIVWLDANSERERFKVKSGNLSIKIKIY